MIANHTCADDDIYWKDVDDDDDADDNGDVFDDDISWKDDDVDNLISFCRHLNLIPDCQSSHYSTKSIKCQQDENDGDWRWWLW